MRKIVDDHADDTQFRLSVPVIFDAIKRSNSSLNRKPKKMLEDSIERVVDVMKADMGDDENDSVNGDFEGLDDQLDQPPAVVWNAFPELKRAVFVTGGLWRFRRALTETGIQLPQQKHCRHVEHGFKDSEIK